MVDAIRSTTVTANDLRVGMVARTPRAALPTPTASSAPTTPTLSRQMASGAPVEADRVRLIRDAVTRGMFPLSPATVADRLIAAKYEWMQNDPS